MQIVFLIVAVALITLLALKGVPIFYAAFITSVFVLASCGMDVVDGMTGTYAYAFGGSVQTDMFIFIFGAIFGKVLEMSGAVNAIADGIVARIGEKAVVPAIVVAGGIMGYGGISVFVGMFALYPLIFEMFRRANISRTLAPGIYCAAAGSFSVWMPGSPSMQVLLPSDALGTSTFSAAVPGFIVAAVQIAAEIAFCTWYVRHTQRKGLVWEGDDSLDAALAAEARRKKPPFLVALAPMAVLIGVLGFSGMNASLGLFVGVVVALAVYAPYIPWRQDFWGKMQQGFLAGSGALITTCSVVGFGAVVQSTGAFQQLLDAVVGLESNPLVTSVAITAVLAGVCGSGPGGLAMSLPIVKEYFVPMGVNLGALTRALALSTMIFNLPSNSVVSTAIGHARSSYRQSYPMVFVTVSVMSLAMTVLLLALYAVMGLL